MKVINILNKVVVVCKTTFIVRCYSSCILQLNKTKELQQGLKKKKRESVCEGVESSKCTPNSQTFYLQQVLLRTKIGLKMLENTHHV